MANLKEIADNFGVTARHLQNVLDLADAVARISNFESAEGEAKIRIAQLQNEAEVIATGVEQSKAEAVTIIADARELAAEVVSKANARAAKADAAAQASIDDANARVAEIVAAGEVSKAEIAAEIDKLAAVHLEKQIELNDLGAKIERAQAKIAEILGV